MSETGSNQEQNFFRRYWWLLVLILLILVLLCVFVGPGKGLFSPQIPTATPTPTTVAATEAATPPPTDTSTPTATATETQAPTEAPTETQAATEPPTPVVTEPPVICDCTAGTLVCSDGKTYAHSVLCPQPTQPPTEPPTEVVQCQDPKCGQDCANTPACTPPDAASGWFCDNGAWNNVKCDKKPPKCNPQDCAGKCPSPSYCG